MMPLFQIPAVRQPLPETAWQRRIRPGEVLRYHVESNLDGPNGKAQFSYDMSIEVEKSAVKKITYDVAARLTNLKATYDGAAMPSPVGGRSKLFGVIPMKLSATGAPHGISAGGQITKYSMPLMVFTLPDDRPDDAGRFKISKVRIEPLGSLVGSGQIERLQRDEFQVSLGLTFDEKAPTPAFTSKSRFDVATATLRQAEGTYTDLNGTLTFKISRA